VSDILYDELFLSSGQVLQRKKQKDDNLSDLDIRAEYTRLVDLLDIPAYRGNGIEILINGDRIFPSMLQAIDAAESEICFETFIYWSGSIAHRFAWGLTQAARRGVKVHVLLDWWGAFKMEEELIEQMRDAGVRVRYFNPLRWWQLKRLNYRTHRKIMVIDREVAFTGGAGIADVWLGDAASPDQWHDLHYRIKGPVVCCFHDAFLELWSEVLKEPRLAAADGTLAEQEGPESVTAQVMMSSTALTITIKSQCLASRAAAWCRILSRVAGASGKAHLPTGCHCSRPA